MTYFESEELLTLRDQEAFPFCWRTIPIPSTPPRPRNSLTLSGHTHGGQFMLNTATGFNPLMFRYWSGHYTRGDSHLIVSNGVGNSFPCGREPRRKSFTSLSVASEPVLPAFDTWSGTRSPVKSKGNKNATTHTCK